MKFINIWRYFEFEKATGGTWHFPEGVDKKKFRVDGVSVDTRTLEKGNLFVALKGKNFDGVDFIEKAKDAGASALVVPKLCDIDLPQLVVEDTLDAFQQIGAALFREAKARGLRSIAITGSNGKTSTKLVMFDILCDYGYVCRTPGNFNNEIGVPITLCQLEYEHDFLILEIGANHFGEIEHLISLAPTDVRIVVSIGDAHLKYFKDREGVLRAKREIFAHSNEETFAIVNSTELDELFPDNNFPGKICTIIDRTSEFSLLHEMEEVEDKRLFGFLSYRVRFPETPSDAAHMEWSLATKMDSFYLEGAKVPSIGPVSERYVAFSILTVCLIAVRTRRSYMGYPEVRYVDKIEAFSKGRGQRFAFMKKGFDLKKRRLSSRMFYVRPSIGQLIFIDDAYNANPTSMRLSASYYGKQALLHHEIFQETCVPNPFPDYPYKRIAVIGQMNELSEDEELKTHREVAAEIAKDAYFDLYYWCGKYAQEMLDAASEVNNTAEHKILEDLTSAPKIFPPFGFVFLKASRSMKLEQIIESFKEDSGESGEWTENTPYRYYTRDPEYISKYS